MQHNRRENLLGSKLLTMVARALPTKLGRICEISFKICHLPRWLEDAVDALGMQRMKSEERRRDGRWGGRQLVPTASHSDHVPTAWTSLGKLGNSPPVNTKQVGFY